MKKTFLILGILGNVLVYANPAPGSVSEARERYDGIIQAAAREHRIPAELIHSIIQAESNYDSDAVSRKGAGGLMQLMPATAEYYGVKDRFNPVDNIDGGVKYLKDLMTLYDGQTKLVLAAYNAGQEAVKKYDGIPPYPETLNYIKRVQKGYAASRIGPSTRIYRFTDERGRVVFTNDRSLYLKNTKRSSKSKENI
jgi:soluble lytic murein transglycosylase-like protein